MRWIHNISIAAKVSLAPSLAIACLILVGAIGLLASERMRSSLSDLGDNSLKQVITTSELLSRINQIDAMAYRSLAWEGAGVKAEKIEALDKQIATELKNYQTQLAQASTHPNLDATEKDLLQSASKAFGLYSKSVLEALDIKTGMLANAVGFMTTMEQSHGQVKSALAGLVQHERQRAQDTVAQGYSLASRNQWLILGFSVMAIAASLAAAWTMARAIAGPLGQAARQARAVSEGDLSHSAQASSTDATGQVLLALADMSASLSTIVHEIRSAAEMVQNSSVEIAAGNLDLSRRTELQSSNLQRTVSEMDQLVQTVQGSAETAHQANAMADSARQAAQDGSQVVGQVVQTMQEISQSSRKIADITSVIDAIAFQTNILALNAAVEAARAGEQGRGFAVVAGEVRMLAGRSAEAAREIKQLITESVQRIESGERLVTQAGGAMHGIVGQVMQVADLIRQISAATTEQATGLNQVSIAVTELDDVTQQNASLVEQASAAADSLAQQAVRLVDSVARFKLNPSPLRAMDDGAALAALSAPGESLLQLQAR